MAVSRPKSASIIAKATCQVSDDVGKCVYAISEPVDGIYDVTTVDVGDWAKLPAVAVIIDKITTTFCRIQFLGPMPNVVAGLNVGRAIFVGDDGSLTETPPTPPHGGSVFVQAMGASLGSSVVMINPSFSLVRRIG